MLTPAQIPEVTPFFHADSGTWTYLVADPGSGRRW